ncbi:MAG: hypothetical protein WCC92_17230 [Candidatus Korobacteraceae bacterium]
MTRSGVFKVVGLIIIVLLLAAAYLLWPIITHKVEHRVGEIGLTSNERAANGPLPGDVTLYLKELACQQKIQTGYYQSINGAEVADAQRSNIFPCATFTGSYTEPNQVFAYRGEDEYPVASYLNNRKPGEIYIVGGSSPPSTGIMPVGPFVAKADSASGKQIWRTYLWNGNTSDAWIGNTNLNILPNGNIVESWSTHIVLLDGDTGLILKENTLPSGAAAPLDANFKHVTMAPDGTLILKDQTRPAGCKLQGTLAIMFCPPEYKQANSELVAVNPDTLEILDAVELPQPSSVPHTITIFEGKIAIYIGANSGGFRYFWDPKAKKLSQDKSWVPNVLLEGQTTPAAPSILGDWIVFQTDGILTDKVASTIVAVNAKDASNLKRIFPFGQLKPGEMSFCLPKPEVDPENNMIYSADWTLGKVAGIKIDQASGDLKTAFVLDDATSSFQPLIGPPDKRVLLLSNVKRNIPDLPFKAMLATQNYKEQVTWRDAATGRMLAESDFFEPMGLNNLLTPGFGGRVYYLTAKGIIILQVVPKSSLTAKK